MKRFVLEVAAVLVLLEVGHAKAAIVLTLDALGTPVITTPALETNHQYLVEVSGTYKYNSSWGVADAEWSNYSYWSVGPGAPWIEDIGDDRYEDALDVLIDGTAVDWRGTEDGITFAPHTYSPTHVYRYKILGAGQPVTFQIADYLGAHPTDNSGSLQLEITDQGVIPEPTTLIIWSALGALAITFAYVRRGKRQR